MSLTVPESLHAVWLASTGIDGTVRLWNPAAGAEVGEGLENGTAVWAMDAGRTADGQPILLCGGVDGSIRCWDPASGRLFKQLDGHGNTINALVRLGSGTTVASSDVDGMIKIWDVVAQRDTATLVSGSTSVNGLTSIVVDGVELLASGDADGRISLWHVGSGRLARQWQAHQGLIWSLVPLYGALPQGCLASTGVDGRIRLWDPAAGTEAGPSFGHDKVVYDLAAISGPDGNYLVSAAIDGEIRVWAPTRAELINSYQAHDGPVRSLASVPMNGDRSLVASGGGDGAVRLWRPVSGEPLAEFQGHWGSVLALTLVDLPSGPRSRYTEESVARVRTAGFADRAASVDLLGRAAIVEVIADVLSEAAAGHGPDSGAAVVSVEGPWGSGKTTVMQLVRERLERQAADVADTREGAAPPAGWMRRLWSRRPLTVAEADWFLRWSADRPPRVAPWRHSADPLPVPLTAWFNPWAHQSSEQVWAGLTGEILAAAGTVLYPNARLGERYWFASNLDRLDRRYFKREMWKRVASPLLRFSALVATIPVVAIAISRQLDPAAKGISLFGSNVSPGQIALIMPLTILMLGLLHTSLRYVFGRASSFLPSELFRGPLLSGALADADSATRAALRDPLYDAKSGYLYLLQHDVRRVLRDVEGAGRELTIFIDDLDRCGSGATAEVIEAINLFLSESFPRTRFVIGLDPVIVTAHIDESYSKTVLPDARLNTDDPSPGWTFLRKIIQLPVVLPHVSSDGIDRLLQAMLGDIRNDEVPLTAALPTGVTTPHVKSSVSAPPVAVDDALVPVPGLALRADGPGATDDLAKESSPEPEQIEAHPAVRSLLRDRLVRQIDLSARHTKRLLNVWQYQVRLFDRLDRVGAQPAVLRARALVLVAEILTRWPAHLRWLRQPTAGRTGMQHLVGCRFDDVEWRATLARLGVAEEHAASLDALREVLMMPEGAAAADLFARVT